MTPDGWRDVRLQDLAANEPDAFVDGDWIESKDQDEHGTIRLLQVGNVLRGRLKISGSHRWVNEQTARRLNCSILREGDILIARMPDPIGRACLVPRLDYPAITAVDCAILRVDPDTVAASFAVQYFNSDHHLASVASNITGTTRQRVSRTNLGRLAVLLPTLSEQRKIAAILSAVDNAIEATQAVIDQLQAVKMAMMADLLTRGLPGRHTRFKQTDIGEVPETWDVVSVRSLSSLITKGTTPTTYGRDYVAVGVPFLRVENIGQSGELVMEGVKQIDRATHELLTRSKLQPGDVLFSIAGALGRVAVVPASVPEANTNQAVALVRPVSPADALYLSLALRAPFVEKQTALGRAALAQANLSLVQVGDMLLAWPPQAERVALQEVLACLLNRLSAEEVGLKHLLVVKGALMSVLLNGEVRVTPDENAA